MNNQGLKIQHRELCSMSWGSLDGRGVIGGGGNECVYICG